MYRSLILICLFALPATGYSRMVGGTCEYVEQLGTARIVHEQNGSFAARFFSVAEMPNPEALVRVRYGMKFPLKEKRGRQADKIYPAQVHAISKGSCTPYSFFLLESPIGDQ